MSRSPIVAAVAAVLLGAGVVAADALVPPPEPERPVAAESVEAVSGAWVCPVGDGRDGSALRVTVARPGAVEDGPTTLDLGSVEDGRQQLVADTPPVFPDGHVRSPVEGGEDAAATVRWSGGPVAVHRDWRLVDLEDAPSGMISGACTRPIAERWVVPGMSTVGGSEAHLRVANPFPTDATIAVGFVTPEGPQEPLALQNLTVGARATLDLTVNDAMPEQADLAAVVRVLSGRVAVEGYQLTHPGIGDVQGASLLAASTEPAERWTVPWVSAREGDASWLWVTNLGDRPAPVELTLHTEEGGVLPEGLSELTVAPGQVRRVDLRGTLPEGVTSAAITARSDGAPIHVSGVVSREADDVADTAFVVQRGAPAPDARWVVSGGQIADGRIERLHLVNPGSEPAEVDVTLFDGATVLRPDGLQGLTLAPGQEQQVPVHEELGDVEGWSAFVTASTGEVVVGRVGAGGAGALALVAAGGTPSTDWAAGTTPRVHRLEDGLVQRLGGAIEDAAGPGEDGADGSDDTDGSDGSDAPAPTDPEVPADVPGDAALGSD